MVKLNKFKAMFVLVLLMFSLTIITGCDQEGSAEDTQAVVCNDAEPGETITVNGKEYLVVDDDSIKEAIENKERVCTSHVTNMTAIFSGEDAYFEQINISDWDVKSVKDMNSMFEHTQDFNQDIGDWDVSNVENMRYMFHSAESFNQDIGNWDVESVTDMKAMFYFAESFNQDIGDWDVESVINMRRMFYRANNFTQNISAWDTSNVKSCNLFFLVPDGMGLDSEAENGFNLSKLPEFENCRDYPSTYSNWRIKSDDDDPFCGYIKYYERCKCYGHSGVQDSYPPRNFCEHKAVCEEINEKTDEEICL